MVVLPGEALDHLGQIGALGIAAIVLVALELQRSDL
jgi:hypothetical protein